MLKIRILPRQSRCPRTQMMDGNEVSELSHNPHNSLPLKHTPATRVNGYAKCEDFRQVFLENVDSFYQLCFLLTSDARRAEQCVISGLDDCVRSHQVFRDWAHPWAKRTLVQNAIRALQPRPSQAESSSSTADVPHVNPRDIEDGCFDIASVLLLQDFERFVFVLSVLDLYSDRECAFLLGCFVEDVRNARTQAVEKLAASNYMGRSNLIGVNEKF
jgi:DNA-directed RNA polymerase specialized sigma24 family protein